MHEPLEFYPARSVALTQYWFVAGAGTIGLLLLWSLVTANTVGQTGAWARDAAKLVGIVAAVVVAGIALRRARRIAAARSNGEPQLVIDPFGILIRDDFLWRPHRFPWSRIRSIAAVPDDKGVSIVLTGELRPLGRLVDITTDSSDPAEAIAYRLERFAHRRPTLH